MPQVMRKDEIYLGKCSILEMLITHPRKIDAVYKLLTRIKIEVSSYKGIFNPVIGKVRP